jgi:hypothetical protein
MNVHIVTALGALLVWLAVGVLYVARSKQGWLIMLCDDRNVKHTWVAIPCLIICYFLWPIYPWLSRQMFLFMLRFN